MIHTSSGRDICPRQWGLTEESMTSKSIPFPPYHSKLILSQRLLDLLFKFFTSWCLRVVPALFLRDMYRALSVPASQPPPKTPHYSPMLHNALIALAAAFSDDPRICDLATRQKFATVAKGYIDVECQKPNICVVQALSLLGSFHSSQGDENLGYMYFGESDEDAQNRARLTFPPRYEHPNWSNPLVDFILRAGCYANPMSYSVGLNIDCSGWVKSGLISHDDMLDRNWAHWTSFSLVCLLTCPYARHFSQTVF